MTDDRIGDALRAIQQGPPLTTAGKRVLATLSKSEVQVLGRRLARAQGVPDGEFLPTTVREQDAEIIIWKGAYDQTLDKFGGTEADEAISNAAVACADAMVKKFAASGHNIRAR